MKYLMITFCVLVLWAITGWMCYGLFQSETLSLSVKYVLSALTALFGFAISFAAGVFVNKCYPFDGNDDDCY